LQVHLSQRELGNICGAGRESINKCLGLWQRRGIAGPWSLDRLLTWLLTVNRSRAF